MPRKPPIQHDHTPFGDLLLDYMWNQRQGLEPPLTLGQLAVRLGMSRMTLQKWVYDGVVPSLTTAMQIFAKLDIPLERLIRAYERDEIPTPPIADLAAPDSFLTDEWASMAAHTAAELRSIGLDEATIATVLDHIAEKRANQPPLARHIAAEHTEPKTTVPSQTTTPRARRTTARSSRAKKDS